MALGYWMGLTVGCPKSAKRRKCRQENRPNLCRHASKMIETPPRMSTVKVLHDTFQDIQLSLIDAQDAAAPAKVCGASTTRDAWIKKRLTARASTPRSQQVVYCNNGSIQMPPVIAGAGDPGSANQAYVSAISGTRPSSWDHAPEGQLFLLQTA